MGLCGDFDEKMGRLARILNKADDLRLKTIETVVELLTPQQAAEFLVAASELHFGIHAWGVEQDRQRGNAWILEINILKLCFRVRHNLYVQIMVKSKYI